MRRFINIKFAGPKRCLEFVLRAPNGLWHGFQWVKEKEYLGIDAGLVSLDFYGPKFAMRFMVWMPVCCLELWVGERKEGSCK